MDLVKFLGELAKSPALREEFIRTPKIVADRFNLSAKDQAALRTGDQSAIDGALRTESRIIWVVSPNWVVDPNP